MRNWPVNMMEFVCQVCRTHEICLCDLKEEKLLFLENVVQNPATQ
jgi:hypothetical protein